MTPPELQSLPQRSSVSSRQAFLLRVAELLHVFGTPAFRLERVLLKLAGDLGVGASFLSTPTAVVASLERSSPAGGAGTEAPGGEEVLGRGLDDRIVHLMRCDGGEVNLGKLVEFDEIMDRVGGGELEAREGLERLEAVAAAPSRYHPVLGSVAFGLASAGAAVFFRGGWLEVLGVFVISIALQQVARLTARRSDAVGLLEPVAAFGASLAAVLGAYAFGLDLRAVTLASLIVLIPGLTMTVGFVELATRHLVSGMSRLAGAGAVFLTLLLGVALGWRVGPMLLGLDEGLAAAELARTSAAFPDWGIWGAVLVAPFAFGIVLEARPRELPVIFLASAAGFAAAFAGQATLGPDLGPFLGALTVGVVANAYARLVDRPALVPLTPGIFMLVPGSLGFRSLTSFLDADSLAGMSWAFQAGMVAASLVGGLLLANLVVPPRRVL